LHGLAVARRYKLSVSSIALRYFRAVVTIEAMILILDPQFAYGEHLGRGLLDIQIRDVRRRNTPDAAATALVGLLALLQRLPQRVVRSINDLDDISRTIGNWLNVLQGGMAWVLRVLAFASGLASLASLLNIVFGFVRVRTTVSFIGFPVLAFTSVILASLARRLTLMSLSVSE
jgi:hypothetical protein